MLEFFYTGNIKSLIKKIFLDLFFKFKPYGKVMLKVFLLLHINIKWKSWNTNVSFLWLHN